MSILNLRGEESPEEPDGEITLPETPPGLDAIRAWLQKPRPWLHGLRLWIRWILSGGPEAWRLLKTHGPPAAKRLGNALRKIAARGAPVTRTVARAGKLLHDLGVRISAAPQALQDRHGKETETQTKVRETGEAARRLGKLITAVAELVGAVLTLLGQLISLFGSKPPPRPDVLPEPTDTPEPQPGLPEPTDTPEPQPGPPALPTPKPGPEEHPATTLTESGHSSPPERPREDLPPDSPDSLPPEPPAPRPTPTPAPAPAPTPAPSPAPATKPTPATTTPPTTPEAALEARLKGLPKVLHPRVLGLRERTRRDVLHPLILDICRVRAWTTPAELARWLRMHQSSLVQRHLSPLVNAGLLELKFSDSPNRPDQAYRTPRQEN